MLLPWKEIVAFLVTFYASNFHVRLGAVGDSGDTRAKIEKSRGY